MVMLLVEIIFKNFSLQMKIRYMFSLLYKLYKVVADWF